MGRTIQTINTIELNTAPPLELTCQRNGTAINLSGCSVALVITNAGVQTNTITTCTVTNATAGMVTYVRHATDTPTAGTYLCDLVVTYGDGTVEVLYTQLKLNVQKKSNSTT